MKTSHPWQFPARFRSGVYGWRSSSLAVQRIKEAIKEIKAVAKKDPALGAEGAVRFLEKLSPAIEGVDSSSGALGNATNHAVETMATIIAKAEVDIGVRRKWLERLFEALQEDQIPYIETLADHWGTLCAAPELASQWADQLLSITQRILSPTASGHGYFVGTSACLSSLFTAGRHEELITLLDSPNTRTWHYRQWAVRALLAQGKNTEALRYAEKHQGLNDPFGEIAATCEEILLSSGLVDEAYQRYGLSANQHGTHLATFRAIANKYPSKSAEIILRDLAARTPGAEGQWFAAAKDAGLYDLALEWVNQSPTDPRTLMRAARDFREKAPTFVMGAGMAALRWIAAGHGYQITEEETLEAYHLAAEAAAAAGMDPTQFKQEVKTLLAKAAYGPFMADAVLKTLLSGRPAQRR